MLKNWLLALSLAICLSVTALAGDTHTPGDEPPPCSDCSTISSAPSSDLSPLQLFWISLAAVSIL